MYHNYLPLSTILSGRLLLPLSHFSEVGAPIFTRPVTRQGDSYVALPLSCLRRQASIPLSAKTDSGRHAKDKPDPSSDFGTAVFDAPQSLTGVGHLI